jgi:cation transport ATPase-like protein
VRISRWTPTFEHILDVTRTSDGSHALGDFAAECDKVEGEINRLRFCVHSKGVPRGVKLALIHHHVLANPARSRTSRTRPASDTRPLAATHNRFGHLVISICMKRSIRLYDQQQAFACSRLVHHRRDERATAVGQHRDDRTGPQHLGGSHRQTARHVRSNPYALGAVVLSIGLQLAAMYIDPLAVLLRVEPLMVTEWAGQSVCRHYPRSLVRRSSWASQGVNVPHDSIGRSPSTSRSLAVEDSHLVLVVARACDGR